MNLHDEVIESGTKDLMVWHKIKHTRDLYVPGT